MDLTGRVALVTGGAGRIGAAIVETLAQLGAAIVIVDMDDRRGDEVARQVTAEHATRVLVMAADLENKQTISAIPIDVEKAFGRLDVLINRAALVGTSDLGGWAVPFAEQGLSTWERALAVNLTAAFALTQLSAPLLTASGSGSIINVSSIYGLFGPDMRLYEETALGNPAAYAASKGGLLQLTRWLATVLAPRIRVNAITPGGILRNQPESFVRRYVERTPMRPLGTE